MSTEARYFLCTGECVPYEKLHEHGESHILGHLRPALDDGNRMTTLALWHESVPANQVPPMQPVIDVELLGGARNIRCRYPGCDHRESWEIGKDAFLALMSRYWKANYNKRGNAHG